MNRYEDSAEAVAARRRWYDTVENAGRNTPNSFRDQAYEAVSMVDALDADPVNALDDIPTRIFVNRLTRIGFVREYQCALQYPQHTQYAAGSRASLPKWLQPEFLRAQGLPSWPAAPRSPEAVEATYRRFLSRNGLKLHVRNENGEYYGSDVQYRRVPSALHFKMYIEGTSLEAALQNGQLQQAYTRFTQDPSGLRHMKLHDRERLVLYFRSSILTAGPYAEDVLSKYQVSYRGPAQDVERIKTGSARPVLEPNASNDQALNENPFHWNKYNPHPYQPQAFMDTYLRQCAIMGKSPTDPYRTAFITMYMDPGDARLANSTYIQEAQAQAAPYQLVIHPLPHFPPPLDRPAP